jgi:hypothetical protein
VVLTWILVGAFVVEWRDEMALRASKFVNRTHDMGGDIGTDL